MIFIKSSEGSTYYAKLWSVNLEGKFPKGRISTSEKDARDPNNIQWINSSWFVTFMGKAAEKVKKVNGDERIVILSGKLSNISKKLDDGSYKNYFNFVIFDFDVQDAVNTHKHEEQEESVEDDSDDLPF